LKVVNEKAPDLKFPADKLRSRRDQVKYLYLINAVALLHQHQREVKKTVIAGNEVEYIEVADEDVRRANRIAREVFCYSLDELAQGSRRLLKAVDEMVRARIAEKGIAAREHRFSRREIRKWTGWSDFQIRDHIAQLVELEYLYERQGRRGKEFVYELGYDPEEVAIELVEP
jgi:Fic family protein